MSEPPALSSPHSQPAQKLSKEQYTTLMKDTFAKIQKTVPSRKNKQLIEVCKQASGKRPLKLTLARRVHRF